MNLLILLQMMWTIPTTTVDGQPAMTEGCRVYSEGELVADVKVPENTLDNADITMEVACYNAAGEGGLSRYTPLNVPEKPQVIIIIN